MVVVPCDIRRPSRGRCRRLSAVGSHTADPAVCEPLLAAEDLVGSHPLAALALGLAFAGVPIWWWIDGSKYEAHLLKTRFYRSRHARLVYHPSIVAWFYFVIGVVLTTAAVAALM